jgi:lysophospholipase L1-like esterase
MKFSYLFVLFSLLTLSLTNGQTSGEKKLAIVFIGNSITERPGVKGGEAPPFYTAEYLNTKKGIADVRFANAGKSGATTLDFLPGTGKRFEKVISSADELTTCYADHQLIFSIKLGTNDSAIHGPNGAPVLPENYKINLQTIIDELLKRYPNSLVVINHGIWYSTNTYNKSKYLEEGLVRLQTYFPKIDNLVKEYKTSHPGRVFLGDTKAFRYFKKHHKELFIPENGQQGIFYLHPNDPGVKVLAKYWSKAIANIL